MKPYAEPAPPASAADPREAALARALAAAEITVAEVAGLGSARLGPQAIALTVPNLGPRTACAVLFSDESGLYHWLLPRPPEPYTPSAQSSPSALRASGSRGHVFQIPRALAIAADSGAASGVSGATAPAAAPRTRVLTWSTEAYVGLGAIALARRVEAPVRPYGFLMAGPEGWSPDIAWDAVDGRRSLLLLHGTFSTAEAAFHALARPDNAAFQALLAQYGGRVLAFNHPSLHPTPAANAQALLRQVPESVALDLDILTHSRGALVARELAGRADLVNPYRRALRVGRVVFVAAPQRGTALADGQHWQELLDRMTNLAARGPAAAFERTALGIVAAVKLLAQGALGGLPGLACLGPKSGYLARLNAGAAPGATFFALAGAYSPPEGALRRAFSDTVFGEPNDGVVPTAGGYATGRVGAGFPLPPERYRVFDLGDRLYHSAFFEHEAVNRQVLAWLAEGAAEPWS